MWQQGWRLRQRFLQWATTAILALVAVTVVYGIGKPFFGKQELERTVPMILENIIVENNPKKYMAWFAIQRDMPKVECLNASRRTNKIWILGFSHRIFRVFEYLGN